MTLSEDKFYRARVIERLDFAPGLWKIRVDPGGQFNFVAGQYATLGVRTPEKLVERAYSIVSSPYEESLEFFIELVPEGQLTPLLYNIATSGELSMRKIAKGRFTLDFKSGHKNHLLLSTVTGVAPYVSYVRTLYKDWKENHFPANIHLYIIHAGSRSWELGYAEELQKMAMETPWLDFLPSISRPWEDQEWKGETGRVEDIVRKYADRWNLSAADTSAYLCGHPQMIENGIGILQRCGYDKKHLRVEVYWIPGKEGES